MNLNAIVAIARQAPEVSIADTLHTFKQGPAGRIGVIIDRAFSFYYPENLEALRKAGADLVTIDALSDRHFPEMDGLYIGGGFPEIYRAANWRPTADSKGDWHAHRRGPSNLCGMCRIDVPLPRDQWHGRRYEMVGVIPAGVELSRRPAGHGYVETEVAGNNPWFSSGVALHGHEFHHSRLVPEGHLTSPTASRAATASIGRVDGVGTRTCLLRTCTYTPWVPRNGRIALLAWHRSIDGGAEVNGRAGSRDQESLLNLSEKECCYGHMSRVQMGKSRRRRQGARAQSRSGHTSSTPRGAKAVRRKSLRDTLRNRRLENGKDYFGRTGNRGR